MNEERLEEPVSSIFVLFEKGAIKPISFRWSNRDYKITKNNMSWIDRKTNPVRRGFSVTVESGEVFQLCYREGDPTWRIETVIVK